MFSSGSPGEHQSCCSVASSASRRQEVDRCAYWIRRCDFMAAGEGNAGQAEGSLRGPPPGISADLGPELLLCVGCQVPKVFTWHFRCVGEERSSKLLRGAPTRSCVGEPTAIPFGKCCAAAWPAPMRRWRRRDGEVRVARDAYPQSPSWLPGCRRHPTLRWCRVGWLPCTLEAYCACEAHDLIGMGAERHRNRAGLRRNAASRYPRVAATGCRWSLGRGVSTSRQAAAKVEVASRQSWSTREVRAANPFEEPWTHSQRQ